MSKTFDSVLVANRGEIAVRVLHTLRLRGIRSISVYTPVDAQRPHRLLADQSVALPDNRSYLDGAAIIEVAKQTGAEAIHPGYGFLAENPQFSQACQDAGIVFIGPGPEAIKAFGDKRTARGIAEQAGVPTIPGAQSCDSVAEAAGHADKVGLPVLLKAAAGGGGKGMRPVHAMSELEAAFTAAQREAMAGFGDDRLLLEKYIHPARHIEVQILAGDGQVVAVGDRECSLQRRYQKVLEEGPAASILPETRAALYQHAESLLQAVAYRGAATVEFLVGPDQSIYFLEVNTRLQVEHPVTELTTGLDLVDWQLRVAAGQAPPPRPDVRGHALEVRINAEDAFGGYLPQTGPVAFLQWPQGPGVRIDSGVWAGSEISADYDSMIAKLIVHGTDRVDALDRLRDALDDTHILGLTTNVPFLRQLCRREEVSTAETFTTTLEGMTFEPEPLPQWLNEAWLQNQKSAGANVGGGTSSVGDNADRYSPWEPSSGNIRRGFRMGALS